MNNDIGETTTALTKDVIGDSSEILNKIKAEFTEAKAVCWMHYGLFFCKIKSGHLILDKEHIENFNKHLMRLRVFAEDKELHIWRSGSSLLSRMRDDKAGEKKIPYLDSDLILWGTRASFDPETNITTVSEDRGTSFKMPFFDREIKLDNKHVIKRIILRTRNYLCFNKLGQAGYVDCRFMDITEKTFDK
jgi:CRISPR-associated protein (TIGR03984 family)